MDDVRQAGSSLGCGHTLARWIGGTHIVETQNIVAAHIWMKQARKPSSRQEPSPLNKRDFSIHKRLMAAAKELTSTGTSWWACRARHPSDLSLPSRSANPGTVARTPSRFRARGAPTAQGRRAPRALHSGPRHTSGSCRLQTEYRRRTRTTPRPRSGPCRCSRGAGTGRSR